MLSLFPEIQTDVESMLQADVESSARRVAFIAALSARSSGRRLSEPKPLYALFDLVVVYELKDKELEGGVLNKGALKEAAAFESRLRSSIEYTGFCREAFASDESLCLPGLSAANYGLPSRVTKDGIPIRLRADGSGRDPLLLTPFLDLLQRNGLIETAFPMDFDRTLTVAPTQLRSVFRFKLPVATTESPQEEKSAAKAEADERWRALMTSALLPILSERQELNEDSSDAILLKLWYGGTAIEGMVIMDQLRSDLMLAIGSVAFVFMCLMFHTGSILLTVVGVLCIVLAIPSAYIIFVLLKGLDTSLGLPSFLALFVIIGFGADNIFVYTDFWHDSADEIENPSRHENPSMQERFRERLEWTYKSAGAATFATTFTTSLSFFANLASVMRPLREFGLFMGLCVVMVWVLVSLIYAPICLLEETHCTGGCGGAHCRRRGGQRRGVRRLDRLASALRQTKYLACCVPILLAAAAGWKAIEAFEMDSAMPNLFPETHNLNAGQEAMEQFAGVAAVLPLSFPGPPVVELVCAEDELAQNHSLGSCPLFWCEANSIPDASNTSCACFHNATDSGDCEVEWRMVGLERGMTEMVVAQLAATLGGVLSVQVGNYAYALIQDWITGMIHEYPVLSFRGRSVAAAPVCSNIDHRVCFCGDYACNKMPAEMTQSTLQLARRMTDSSGNLSFPTRGSPQDVQGRVILNHAEVEVVFGISVDSSMSFLGGDEREKWEFKSGFDMAQPWTQRDMYSLCADQPGVLQIVRSYCWIVAFKAYVEDNGDRFPVPHSRFMDLFSGFLADASVESRRGPISPSGYLWTSGDTVQACFMVFELDFSADASTEYILEEMKHWDSFLSEFNGKASESASGAFHTSEIWVRAEAQNALISSTITTLGIVICLAFVAMFLVTKNAFLSLLVTFFTVGVILCLLFFVVIVLQWAIGAVEVISLIVFIGYALDYSLHIAHKYASQRAVEIVDDDLSTDGEPYSEGQLMREKRVTHALRSIGPAALGSAVTTGGSAIFLLFTTITIFKEIGIMVLIMTSISIITALVPLPAALLVCGPRKPTDDVGIVAGVCKGLAGNCRSTMKKPVDQAREILDSLQGGTGSLGEDTNEDWSQRREVTVGLQSFQPSKDTLLEVNSRASTGKAVGSWIHVPKHVALEAL